MEKRIKFFSSDHLGQIENTVNDFLKLTNGRLHDVVYDREVGADPTEYQHTILITYSEEKDEEKKDNNAKENEKSHARIQGRITPLWEQGRPYCKI